MTVFVTGASGFLGRFLVPFLEKQGHEVARGRELPSEQKFDRIYHLAAWTQAGDFCLRHPGEQWIINQQINTRVLEWWKTHQPQAKLIAMGTSCSYAEEGPLEEEHYLEGRPIESLYTYAMTKRMLLVGLKALHKQFGLEYLYLVPSTLYGKGYHTDGRQMHFIFDLIRKILRGQLHGERVVLWGDGEQKREVVHVEDFIASMDALTERVSNEVVNIGAGCEYSIREFASMICDEVGYPFEKIEFDRSRYVGAKSKVLSVEKLRQLLPEFQTREVTEGIREVVRWFHEEVFSTVS